MRIISNILEVPNIKHYIVLATDNIQKDHWLSCLNILRMSGFYFEFSIKNGIISSKQHRKTNILCICTPNELLNLDLDVDIVMTDSFLKYEKMDGIRCDKFIIMKSQLPDDIFNGIEVLPEIDLANQIACFVSTTKYLN